MTVNSFYTGPGRRRLRVDSWEQLVAAARVGALAETQWVELKAALPETAGKANLELARDLASLSIDGGVLIIGVRDPGDTADAVIGTTDPVEGLKTRVDQVAGSTRIQPALHVQLSAIALPGNPARHVLIVEVPASPTAPHMVDGKYWGRGATGKRPLTDAEASRLWADRRGARDDFEQRLRTPPPELTYSWANPRRMGWLQVLLEPTGRSLTGPLSATLPQGLHPLQLVTNALTFRPQWSPSLLSLNYRRPDPDGVAATSYDDPATADERGLLYLLLADDGRVQALAPALSTYGYDRAQTCISVNHLMELAHQLLQLAAHLGNTYLAYGGPWRVGFYLEGLAGNVSAQQLSGGFLDERSSIAFRADSYLRTTTATPTDLADHTSTVVEALVRDLARSLSLDGRLFPYVDPGEIFQRSG